MDRMSSSMAGIVSSSGKRPDGLFFDSLTAHSTKISQAWLTSLSDTIYRCADPFLGMQSVHSSVFLR